MDDSKGAYRVLVEKPECRRPLGTARIRWKDNIKVGLREVVSGKDWIGLAPDRDRW